MPLESPNVLSGSDLSPCADAGGRSDRLGGRGSGALDPDEPDPQLPLPVEQRANYLPVVELGNRLGGLLALNSELAARLPQLVWRSTPAPLPACRQLDDLIAYLERVEEAASQARATCLFLWEIASAERERTEAR